MNYALQEAAQALDAIERRGGKPPRQTPQERSNLINAQLRQFDTDIVLPSHADGSTNFALQEAAKALEAVDPPSESRQIVSGAAWGGALGAHSRAHGAPGTFALPAPSYAPEPSHQEEMPALLPGPSGTGEELGYEEPAFALPAPPPERQIVPGVLIKFVPPGTLTRPGGYPQAPGPAALAPQTDVHPAIAAAWGTFGPAAGQPSPQGSKQPIGQPEAVQPAPPPFGFAEPGPGGPAGAWHPQPATGQYAQPATGQPAGAWHPQPVPGQYAQPGLPAAFPAFPPGFHPAQNMQLAAPPMQPQVQPAMPDGADTSTSEWGTTDRPHYVPYDHAGPADHSVPAAWRDMRGCITPPSVRDRDALRGSITPPAIPADQSPGSPGSNSSRDSEDADELDSPVKPRGVAAWRGGPPPFPEAVRSAGGPFGGQPPWNPEAAVRNAGGPFGASPAFSGPAPASRGPAPPPAPVSRPPYEIKPPSSRGSSRSSAKKPAARAARMVGSSGGRPQKWTGLSTVCRPVPQPSGAKAPPPSSLLF